MAGREVAERVEFARLISFEYFRGIYLYRDFVDMRKSINGLSAIVSEECGADLFGRSLFVFCNRQRRILKLLYWDSTGFALWTKRLEEARFVWPKRMDSDVIEMSAQALEWLLEGYDVWKLRPHQKLKYEQVS